MHWREASHSFEIRTAGQFLRKLEEDYHDFKVNPLSSRYAINCALTAWHLREWFWAQRLKVDAGEQERLFARSFNGLREFDAFLRDEYPEFRIVQAICNGSKHFQVSSSVDNSFSARIDLSGSRRRFVEGLPRPITLKTAAPKKGTSCLWVSVNDKKHLVRFDEVLKQVLAFWQSKLQSEAYGWGVRPLSRPVKGGGFGRKANTV